jgi:hypothetical protein
MLWIFGFEVVFSASGGFPLQFFPVAMFRHVQTARFPVASFPGQANRFFQFQTPAVNGSSLFLITASQLPIRFWQDSL